METIHHFPSYDGTPLEGTLSGSRGLHNGVALFVHGITSSRDELGFFAGFAAHLEQLGMPSFRFDYRCHGVNTEPMESLTLSGIVNDIEAAARFAVAHIGSTQLHIVGMSFGGGLSAFWASTTEVGVGSLVMLAPVLDYEQDVVGQYGLLSDGVLEEKVGRRLLEHGFLETGGVRYGTALVNELRHFSGAAALRRLACRALIVHGDADSVVPYSSSAQHAALHPGCTLVNIEGTDHGFGVPGDDDLSSVETKARQREVYEIVAEFVKRQS